MDVPIIFTDNGLDLFDRTLCIESLEHFRFLTLDTFLAQFLWLLVRPQLISGHFPSTENRLLHSTLISHSESFLCGLFDLKNNLFTRFVFLDTSCFTPWMSHYNEVFNSLENILIKSRDSCWVTLVNSIDTIMSANCLMTPGILILILVLSEYYKQQRS